MSKINGLGVVSILIGASAAWFLATYLFFSSSVSTIPVVLASIVGALALISRQFRSQLAHPRKNQIFWILGLLGLGIWGMFTAWIHNAEATQYETFGKMVIGAGVAYVLCRFGIHLTWIKIGVTAGSLSLAYLVLENYGGTGRFSPLMNATKWGNAIAYQTILAGSCCLLSKTLFPRLLFLGLAVFGAYAVLITGTRGAVLAIVAAVAAVPLIYLRSFSAKHALVGVIILGVAATTLSQLSIVQSRVDQTINSMSALKQDNWNTSVGIRLAMWTAGLNQAVESPLLGAGYDFKKTVSEYQPHSESLAKTTQMIQNGFENFHSVYIDTTVRSGFTGLLLFSALLVFGLRANQRDAQVLMLAPIVGFAASGLTDSVLSLSITATYLIIGGSILKSVNISPITQDW